MSGVGSNYGGIPDVPGQIPGEEPVPIKEIAAREVGRDKIDVANDPAANQAVLMLLHMLQPPHVKKDQYLNFLQFGLGAFENPDLDPEEIAETEAIKREVLTHDIISDILDSWAESIEKVDEHRRLWENSPWFLSLQSHRSELQSGEVSDSNPLISLSVIVSMVVVSSARAEGVVGSGVSIGSVAEALNTLPNFAQFEGRDEIETVAGFYAMSLAMRTAIMSPYISKMAEKNTGEKPLVASAKAYAFQVVKEVLGPGLDQKLMNLIESRVADDKRITPADKSFMGIQIKMVLLMTALAAIYKAETSTDNAPKEGMVAEELKGLLTGEIPLQVNGMREVLVRLIKAHIAVLPKHLRQETIESVLAYIDRKPTVSELMDPCESLGEVLGKKASIVHGLETGA